VEYKKMDVKFLLDNEQISNLKVLLGRYQKYENKDGEFPFKDWTIEEVFEAVMGVGSKRIINDQIRMNMEYYMPEVK